MKKRVLALLLGVVMCVGLVTSAFAASSVWATGLDAKGNVIDGGMVQVDDNGKLTPEQIAKYKEQGVAQLVTADGTDLLADDDVEEPEDEVIESVNITLNTTGLKAGAPLPEASCTTAGVKSVTTVWKNAAGETVTEFAEAGTYSAEVTIELEDNYKLADSVANPVVFPNVVVAEKDEEPGPSTELKIEETDPEFLRWSHVKISGMDKSHVYAIRLAESKEYSVNSVVMVVDNVSEYDLNCKAGQYIRVIEVASKDDLKGEPDASGNIDITAAILSNTEYTVSK